MIEAKGRKISPRVEKWFLWIEAYGSSIALYILIGMIIMGIWGILPFSSSGLKPSGVFVGWVAFVFILLSALHGMLWWVLTREFITLPPAVKLWLSLSIRLVKPLHMSTGMLGLGFAFLHGFSYLSAGFGWNLTTISGMIGLVTLILLTLDGIGLMMSPFLSRKVHRWIALLFLLAVLVHLVIVLL
ncbi:hypothetical protein CathTA2_1822 [Caldalkalibacillus thermarum TA2.A1]|uniref:Ferric oxidoreductase domain-containing protein n=1 Tax=Caldalkalibacillus thermarum (strain TA2.A1) TaxID=986075 RepID=F5L7M2_CALTT|nr:hypothetical protein [Caldalkalibacillus thermarum]EGL82666.1 hypothetical protein CathTA2_1822 [Caldalkalibacillus thermarum TA2.A1]QZT33384.1 hypothetical protein HUR95_14175 [Caldalkalibacillus thermarum TA2.A1]